MEIINRTDEFWMEFFDPTDAYEDLYVDEKMIIKGIFDNMGIHHKYVFKFESLEEIYPYIHGRIYAYKNLKEVDFKSIFYEKYNTDSFLQYINSYIQNYGNLYLIMKNKIIKIVKWYLIIHLAISSMLLIDYAFFVKESTKITWEGRGYTVTKMILLGPLNILYFK